MSLVLASLVLLVTGVQQHSAVTAAGMNCTSMDEGNYRLDPMSMIVELCMNGTWTGVNCSVSSDSNNMEVTVTSTQLVYMTATPSQSSTVGPTATSEATRTTRIPSCTPAAPDTSKFSLDQQYPYITTIGILFGLLVIVITGWVHTCITVKLRMRKLQLKNKRHEFTKSHELLAMEMATLNSNSLPVNHNYERMKITDNSSDYHCLEREHQNGNGEVLTQLPMMNEMPQDYEYNRLERDDCHDYHEVEGHEGEDYSHLIEEGDSNDYDVLEERRASQRREQRHNYHVLEDSLQATNPTTEDNYHVLEGSLQATNPTTEDNYHVLEGSLQATNPTTEDNYHVLEGSLQATNPTTEDNYHVLECPRTSQTVSNQRERPGRDDYYVLEGPGLASSTQGVLRETSFKIAVPTMTGSVESVAEITTSGENDYHTLEGPERYSGERRASDDETDHNVREGSNRSQTNTTGRENDYHILERPLQIAPSTGSAEDYDQLEEVELEKTTPTRYQQEEQHGVREPVPAVSVVAHIRAAQEKQLSENDAVSVDSDYHELVDATHLDIIHKETPLSPDTGGNLPGISVYTDHKV